MSRNVITTNAYQKVILVGLLSAESSETSLSRLSFASVALRVEHLTGTYQLIYKAILTYFHYTKLLVPVGYFNELIQKSTASEEDKSEAINEFSIMCAEKAISENEFRYNIL